MKKLRRNWLPITIITVLIIIFDIVVSSYLFFSSTTKGAIAAINTYRQAKEISQNETYDNYYDKGYKLGEEQNHVSNHATINIEKIYSTAELEVLHVNDVVFQFSDELKDDENAKDNSKNDIVWIKVNGSGIFTVNLKAAEFIVDNNRQYILAVLPEPELNENNIKISKPEKLLFKGNKFSSSIRDGVELAQDMEAAAKSKLYEDFASNQDYHSAAKKSAEESIKRLISSLNPNIDNLVVEVVFREV